MNHGRTRKLVPLLQSSCVGSVRCGCANLFGDTSFRIPIFVVVIMSRDFIRNENQPLSEVTEVPSVQRGSSGLLGSSNWVELSFYITDQTHRCWNR